MANQVVLEFIVSVAGTPRTPAQAVTDLTNVPLYANPSNDPVLGQLLGLTVESDVTAPTATGAARTLTLSMTNVVAPGTPPAPPPFPCSPITATPPVPPYPLISTEPLPGVFVTVPGSAVVATSETQVPSLTIGATIQFLSQLGVFYAVFAIAPTFITLTAPYTGLTVDEESAVLVEPAPAAIAAIYSSSPLDTNGVVITPPIPAGSGAQTVSLSYLDSTGAAFTVTVDLMGTYPAPVTLHAGSKDIAVVTDLHIVTTGGFGNSVGQITLCQMPSVPYLPPNATPDNFQTFIDRAQMLIVRGLVYLPPSYFALAQQGSSAPSLVGQFQVSPGQTSVATNNTQPGVLVPGNTIEFAVQPGVQYTVQTVSVSSNGIGLVILTEPFYDVEINNPVTTDARVITPSPATPPTTAQLAAPLAEFVNPGNAIPPPFPPLTPATMFPSLTVAPGPAPNFLSGLFARTIQLALAVPVVQTAITFV